MSRWMRGYTRKVKDFEQMYSRESWSSTYQGENERYLPNRRMLDKSRFTKTNKTLQEIIKRSLALNEWSKQIFGSSTFN